MRDLQFRAKRRDNGAWVKSGTLLSFGARGETITCIPDAHSACDAVVDADGNLTKLYGAFCRVREDTVEQFTGAEDADGNDIYDGDIVRHGEKLYVIRWLDRYARFAGTRRDCVFAVFPFGNCTVVGNIHDHPELLEAVL